MTPAQARAFHTVAIEGSFTAAARALNLSQPTLTNQVKQIESRYRVELFHRSSRGVRLTETGNRLLAIARRMFGSFDEAVAFLQEVHGLQQGNLRVGSYEPYEMSCVLARYIERYPGVQVTATCANSPELATRLINYDVDVAILASSEGREELHAVPFHQPRLVAIAQRVDMWAARSGMRPAEFANHTMIIREPGSAARKAFEQLLLEAGISRAKFLVFDSREGVLSAVAAGLGISAVFDEGLLPLDRIVKLPIRGCNIRSDVRLMCLKERRNSAPIRAFIELAAALAK